VGSDIKPYYEEDGIVILLDFIMQCSILKTCAKSAESKKVYAGDFAGIATPGGLGRTSRVRENAPSGRRGQILSASAVAGNGACARETLGWWGIRSGSLIVYVGVALPLVHMLSMFKATRSTPISRERRHPKRRGARCLLPVKASRNLQSIYRHCGMRVSGDVLPTQERKNTSGVGVSTVSGEPLYSSGTVISARSAALVMDTEKLSTSKRIILSQLPSDLILCLRSVTE
jgi:hypothetical protein